MRSAKPFIALTLIFAVNFAIAGARPSSSSDSHFNLPAEQESETDTDSAFMDSILTDSSSQQTEYEPLAAAPGGASLVRKDGLSTDTVNKINLYFKLYGTLANPLKERDAKALRDEVSKVQFYYVQKGGVTSIPRDLKELGTRANILYQNTANERRPASEPAKISPQEKKDICANFPYGMQAFYEKLCMN